MIMIRLKISKILLVVMLIFVVAIGFVYAENNA